MNPEEALHALAETVELAGSTRDPQAAGRAVLNLVLRVSRAHSAFLARVDGDGLRWILGTSGDGNSELPARHLQRVAEGVREALHGVVDAPPTMTGGRAPRGAVAIKAEAGHPPVHAFPLVDPATRTWEGVLGLLPDPSAPLDPQPAVASVLRVLCRLVDPWMLQSGPEPITLDPQVERPEFKHDYDDLVTSSPKFYSIFKKLDRIIGTDVPVLIVGETGTGKELIARAIHRNDPERRSKRFYTQNCGAIPGPLLESELFGYEKGAFTGADRRKEGLFKIASGSTLFLDEIGEMSIEMQTRLLRVLQEKEIVPLGASEPVKVQVRIVAATLRNLEQDVADGRFREDLYYRLKVVRLALPSLRERPEDIVNLVDHFLRKAAREMGQRPKVLDRRDPRILEAFTRYDWPGNVRELENVIRRLAYLSDDVIAFDALAEDRQLLGEPEAPSKARAVRPLDDVVEELERSEIENALRSTRGNRTRAAGLLGINRRSLLRRLKKYGFSEE